MINYGGHLLRLVVESGVSKRHREGITIPFTKIHSSTSASLKRTLETDPNGQFVHLCVDIHCPVTDCAHHVKASAVIPHESLLDLHTHRARWRLGYCFVTLYQFAKWVVQMALLRQPLPRRQYHYS